MSDFPELQTIRDLIRFATSNFNEANLYYGHGTDNAWDDAAALIFHTLHIPHALYAATIDTRVTAAERTEILDLVHQRIEERIPVPYLTNEAWFCGLPFFVDDRVLVPRSPIAELIENQFAPWIEADSVNRILDLCTGSGCIAIACAAAFPEVPVDGSDISADALAVANINLLKHNMEDQVTFIESDLFSAIQPSEQYNIIVSNPPYVNEAEMNALPDEYKHEPANALASGFDGLDITRKILREAAAYLAPNGILIVEVGDSEHELIEAFPEAEFTWLHFERGGSGVFLLTKDQLERMT